MANGNSIFKIALRPLPAVRKVVQQLFMTRVSCPKFIPLSLAEVLELSENGGPLQNQAQVVLSKILDKKFPLQIGKNNLKLDLTAHRAKETIVHFPIDVQAVSAELEKVKNNLYEGKKFYHNLLEISELTPDHIKIGLNPTFPLVNQNDYMSTASNILHNVSSITNGIPDESIKDLVLGNLEGALSLLSQYHPQEVKNAMLNNKLEQILLRQNRECTQKILTALTNGLIKLEKALALNRFNELKPFLPPAIVKGIEAASKKSEAHKLLKYSRDEILQIAQSARNAIEQILDKKLESIAKEEGLAASEEKIREAITWANRFGPWEYLPEPYLDEIARFISEAQRSKIIDEVRKSNLVDSTKKPLLHILAEKESIYVSMFSFTSPLFAAALISAVLRGAQVKILLDRNESRTRYSQYQAMLNFKHPSFEVRIFSGATLHQKNLILGSSRTVITGSQNLSERGLTTNLESADIIFNDLHFDNKSKEFQDLFALSGSFVPFSEQILSQHWIRRAGLRGIRFTDRIPTPSEVSEVLKFFERWREADFSSLRNIQEIAQGKRFELVRDLTSSFHPFMAEIKDPTIVHFLTRFFEQVPLEFSFSAASRKGLLHPGTTAGLAGLIEHEYIGTELALKLCKIIGREDLNDQAILAFLCHDTHKSAWENKEGKIVWGSYNVGHGQLAAKRLQAILTMLDPSEQKALSPFFPDVVKSVSEHMSIFNQPESTPILPADPTLKFMTVIADMLASRKYFYLKHRAHMPMGMDEIIHHMLNNSFSIEGEALTYISQDPELFSLICDCGKTVGRDIISYANLPLRAKKMLRVAESLCDLFPASAEIKGRGKREPTDEELTKMKTRNEILSAALLFAMLRYKHGIYEPESKIVFSKILRALFKKHPNPNSAQNRILNLIQNANEKLSSPRRANLAPKDPAALWVICIANCMMTDPDITIITAEEVENILSKATEPKTIWAKRKTDYATQAHLLAGVKKYVIAEKRQIFMPMVKGGLLAKLNVHRKKPLTDIHPEVMRALVDKYDSLFPDYIYSHFYQVLSPSRRTKMIEKLRDSLLLKSVRYDLIKEINQLPTPETKSPDRVFNMIAQTALANGIDSIEQLKTDVIQSARDFKAISQYNYFTQIRQAVEFLYQKLCDPKEKIMIYGDYDVDGQTGTALLTKTLRWIRTKKLSEHMSSREAEKIANETIDFYIPHRLNEGYGLNPGALEIIERRGFKTIITVDCGIKDRDMVKLGKKMGINFVVTDHHEPEKKLLPQDAIAILNPKLDFGENHPAYGIAGAAVAYKLACALANKAGIKLGASFLDSVALASIADIVPMVGETRAFVRLGIVRINSFKRNKGLSAIIKANRLEKLDEVAIAFNLAPHLNALARLGDAYLAMKLLMARSEKDANLLLPKTFPYLEKRRDIEQAIYNDAEKKISFDPTIDAGIVVAGDWHKGVIGIVASKLIAKYGVPSVTISTAENKIAGGSMRSIKGISAIRILKLCAKYYRKETGQELLIRFGGHQGAAGFAIEKDKIYNFQKIYSAVCKENVKNRREKIVIAATLEEGAISLEEVKMFREILSPFGNSFEEPLIHVASKIKSWQVFGRNHQHIRGELEKGTPFIFFFGNQPWVKRILIQGEAHLVFKLGLNTYRGQERINLIVQDLKRIRKKKT